MLKLLGLILLSSYGKAVPEPEIQLFNEWETFT